MASLRVVALVLLGAAGSVGDVCAQDPEPGTSATRAGEPWAVPAELLLGQTDTNDYKFLPRFSGR
jgi:hypothetical protein